MAQNRKELLREGTKSFAIGGEVWANGETSWCGFRGYTKGIRVFNRNGHTEAVIQCDFEAPPSKEMWERVKENFFQANGKVPMDESILKDVYLDPSSLEPIADTLPKPAGVSYVLVVHDSFDDYVETLAVSARKDYLLRKIDEHLETMQEKVDEVLQLKNVFCSSEQDAMALYYGLGDQLAHESELVYTIEPVPFFACGEEVAA